MLCLVTYDVNKPHHDAVKAQCILAGFRDYVKMPDGSHRQLPNTTLTVRAINAEDAVKKFKEQVGAIVPLRGLMSLPLPAIRIEKVIAVEYMGFFAENEISPGNTLADTFDTPPRNVLTDLAEKFREKYRGNPVVDALINPQPKTR